jgi:hypothetical protein
MFIGVTCPVNISLCTLGPTNMPTYVRLVMFIDFPDEHNFVDHSVIFVGSWPTNVRLFLVVIAYLENQFLATPL